MSRPEPYPTRDPWDGTDEQADDELVGDYCTMCGVLMGPDGMVESCGALCVECCECPKCLRGGSP